MNELYHYGMPRRSGRYPYGSGNRPYQRQEKQKSRKEMVIRKAIGRSEDLNRLVSKNQIDQNGRIYKKKGETVQHITGVEINKLHPGQLYVTATDYDNRLYETFLSAMLKVKNFKPKKLELKLSQELKVPSSNEQKVVFKEMNKSQILDDLSDWMVKKGKASDEDEAKILLSKKSENDLYLDFINSLERSSNSRTNFYTELKKQGFNAVLDEHDRFSWIQAKQPIIIMEVLDVVGDMKISEVSNNRISEALDEWLALNN